MTDLTVVPQGRNDIARLAVKSALLNALQSPALLDQMVEALTLHPCHITGMHSPEHHLEYVCEHQKGVLLESLLGVLGLRDADSLPHRLHESCGWCHDVPSQEKYRERLRKTYEWAGVPIPEDLAALAEDAWRMGDDETVLRGYWDLHLKDPSGWWTPSEVDYQIGLRGHLNPFRRYHGQQNLLDKGVLQNETRSSVYVARLTEHGQAIAREMFGES